MTGEHSNTEIHTIVLKNNYTGEIISGRKNIPHSQSPLNVSVRIYIPHSRSKENVSVRKYITHNFPREIVCDSVSIAHGIDVHGWFEVYVLLLVLSYGALRVAQA